MHRTPLECGQDADSLHPFLSALGMDGVEGEPVGAGDMQPVQLSFNAQASLIEMGDCGGDDALFDGGYGRFSLICQM